MARVSINSAVGKILDNVAAGWHRLRPFGLPAGSAGLPTEIVVRQWGVPGCSRPVVCATFAGLAGSEEVFLTECQDGAEAARYKAAAERRLYKTWDSLS